MKNEPKIIGKQVQYDDYIVSLKAKISKLENKLIRNGDAIDIVKDQLASLLATINSTLMYNDDMIRCNVDMFKILNSMKVDTVKHIEIICKTYDDRLKIEQSFTNYVVLNGIIKETSKTLAEFKTCLVDKNVYNKLSEQYNKQCVLKLLDGGSIKFASNYGSIVVYVNKVKANVKRPDWKKSNAFKAFLINNGRIPYLQEDEEKAKAKGEPYLGEKWLIYNTNENYFNVVWYKGFKTENNANYNFNPCRKSGATYKRAELVKALAKPEDVQNSGFSFIECLNVLKELIPTYELRFFNRPLY